MAVLTDLLGRVEGGDSEQSQRVARLRNDFFGFCQYYFPHLFTDEPAEFHREIIATLLDPSKRRIVLAAPREHGKTTLVYVAYVTWAILTGRARFVLVVGPSADTAIEQLGNVKTELETNERLVEDFGDQRTRIWRQNNLELKNGGKIVAKGAGGSIRGLVRKGARGQAVGLQGAAHPLAAVAGGKPDHPVPQVADRPNRAAHGLPAWEA